MDLGLLNIFAIAIFLEIYENHVLPRQLPCDVDLFFFKVRLSFSLIFFFGKYSIDIFFFLKWDTFIYHSGLINPRHNLNLEAFN